MGGGRSTAVVVCVGACQSQYLANGLHILNIGALRATAVQQANWPESSLSNIFERFGFKARLRSGRGRRAGSASGNV